MEGNQGFNGPMNNFQPLDSYVAVLGRSYTLTGTAMNRFTFIRGNKLHNNARVKIGGACEDVITDGNLVENTEMGVIVVGLCSYHDGKLLGMLLYQNRLQKVNVPLMDYTQKVLSVPVN